MSPSHPIDDWQPGWSSFGEFFADDAVGRTHAPYLTELDHDHGTRRDWTRGQWQVRVAETAAGLATWGIQLGESVSVLAGNAADALAVAFACWTHGWVYLPLNAHETPERQGFILSHANAQILVYSPAEAIRAAQLHEATGVATIPFDEVAAAGEDAPALADGWERPALRVYTSGTTGEPKGVELSTGNLIADSDALARATGWGAETRVIVVLPIHHVNGLVVSCLQSWYVGGSAILCDRFRSDRFWPDVESEGATVSSLVPTLLEFLVIEGGGPAPVCFQEVLCGAGPLMMETVVTFEDDFAIPVRHLYGLSEVTAVATMMPVMADGERQSWYLDYGFPSIGSAIPHVDVQVQDPDGCLCPAGIRGEIVIRGATVMGGYAGRPEATVSAFQGGWFHSGDEGFWQADDDGTPYFFISGRIKELIIRGGINISPFQVDEVLNAHPAVQFGLAVPFENRYYGEEIAAYVVQAAPIAEQEILDFCAERLDFAYCPKVVIFGNDVPFTVTGKAKRLSLKEQLADELSRYRDVQFRRHQSTGQI
ncbi:MAG: acyl--CoA ligase [Acidimicrobiia bacterium]|nr:acyl--CoA ligase [Acidimicrobiia bacterium]